VYVTRLRRVWARGMQRGGDIGNGMVAFALAARYRIVAQPTSAGRGKDDGCVRSGTCDMGEMSVESVCLCSVSVMMSWMERVR